MATKITKTVLDAIPRPAVGTTRLFDSGLPGFGVDIGKTKTTFFVRRRVAGRIAKIKVGESPAITLQEAKDRAKVMLAQMSLGSVPTAPRKVSKAHDGIPTLRHALDAYLQHKRKKGNRPLKESTKRDARLRLETHLADWLDRPLSSISVADVAERHTLLSQASGDVSANRVMSYFSSVFTFALDYFGTDQEPLNLSNPVSRMRKRGNWNEERRRQSYLSEAKLREIWGVIDKLADSKKKYAEHSECVADYLRFLAFVGMRPGEAARLKVSNVDLRERCFVLEESKTGNDFKLPFAKEVAEILHRRLEYARLADSPYVFPSTGRTERGFISCRQQVDLIREVVPGFMLTDFRRTLTTICQHLDPPLSPLVTKRLLNHSSKNVDPSDVTAGYFATDVEWLRKPVDRVAKRVMQLAMGNPRAIQRQAARDSLV